ncbi:hypothetical protein GE061_017050 [Apolygus lucorum]|uniref:Uncharacterized protein n=1 Tax=Apolygus lucorum TaxID=248454 RepID=A0A6A4JFN3_APOLU|nr:hypothetical protein GE061_017050 [Apolygus lucorum]
MFVILPTNLAEVFSCAQFGGKSPQGSRWRRGGAAAVARVTPPELSAAPLVDSPVVEIAMSFQVFLLLFMCVTPPGRATGSVVRLDSEVDLAPEVVDDEIVMSLVARTTGFVALGISVSGAFVGSDIIVAWVDDSTRRGHIIDGHAANGDNGVVEDAEHNYKVLAASQNDTHTVIQFSRMVQTCDKQGDVDIVNDTMRVMWFVSERDPVKSSWKNVEWRGPKSVHLTSPPARRPSSIHPYWDVRAPNFLLPTQSASFYFCKIYKIPQLDSKHHITGFTPWFEKDHEGLIEHMVLYSCLGGDEFEEYLSHPGTGCRDPKKPLAWKSCTTPIVTWAAGSRGEHFPDHVGLPISEGEGKATYFMLEIHYDNPAQQRVQDNSGLRIYYTPNLREYDGSILVTGVTPSSLQIIPPKQKNFTSTGYCDNQCTNLMFPEDGIKIVSVAFHTHSTGRRVKMMRLREGETAQVIAQDDHFDPRFQQSRRLHKEAVILPGDQIITECVYSTINRTRITFGGYTVRDETCLAYVLYYPRAALSSCTSMTPADFFFETFGIRKFYGKNMSDVENLVLKESEEKLKELMPHVPVPSLFFHFAGGGFNLDNQQRHPNILKAMVDISIDKEDDRNIFSDLIIHRPEEFENKSFTAHLKDLPWHDNEFAKSVETILNERRHQTFCRLQNSDLAMPISVYVFPNYTVPAAPKHHKVCQPRRNSSVAISGSPWLAGLLLFIASILYSS